MVPAGRRNQKRKFSIVTTLYLGPHNAHEHLDDSDHSESYDAKAILTQR